MRLGYGKGAARAVRRPGPAPRPHARPPSGGGPRGGAKRRPLISYKNNSAKVTSYSQEGRSVQPQWPTSP